MTIRRLDVKDAAQAETVCALQREAYAVEAELIGFWGIPPLQDTPQTLAESPEQFYGGFIGEELAGLVAYTVEGGVLDVCRVAVSPRHFRQGVASALLEFAEGREGARRIIVSTGTKNLPAVSLYLKHDFSRVGEEEVAKGVFITRFEKHL